MRHLPWQSSSPYCSARAIKLALLLAPMCGLAQSQGIGAKALLGPVEFSVVDLRPEDGVPPSVSFIGVPVTVFGVSVDNVDAVRDETSGWWSEFSLTSSGSTVSGAGFGYSISTELTTGRETGTVIYTTNEPFFGSTSWIELAAFSKLTMSAQADVQASCLSSSAFRCDSWSRVGFGLQSADPWFTGLSVSSDGGLNSASDLLSLTVFNYSGATARVGYYIQMNTYSSLQAIPVVAEPGSMVLALAGLGLLACRMSRRPSAV